MLLTLGSRGEDVRQLQLKLKAAGYNPGYVDGVFGPKTQTAVLAFQADFDELIDDGVAGPLTVAKLNQTLAIRNKETPPHDEMADAPVPCEAKTWAWWLDLVKVITQAPVRYGPGRGLFVNGDFIVTYGPGALKSRSWASAVGVLTPSFHCSSFTNFALGALLRYNQEYTHAGNIPEIDALLEADNKPVTQPNVGTWRGYGPYVTEIATDGSGKTRTGQDHYDAVEVYERRERLPTFMVCAQSTRFDQGWKWWHHTLMFVVDHNAPGHPLYRIAADGYYGTSGWSGDPMRWVQITPANIGGYARAIYRVWGVDTKDGTYGDPSRPMAKVVLEQP